MARGEDMGDEKNRESGDVTGGGGLRGIMDGEDGLDAFDFDFGAFGGSSSRNSTGGESGCGGGEDDDGGASDEDEDGGGSDNCDDDGAEAEPGAAMSNTLVLGPKSVQGVWRGLRVLEWLELPSLQSAVAGVVFAAVSLLSFFCGQWMLAGWFAPFSLVRCL